MRHNYEHKAFSLLLFIYLFIALTGGENKLAVRIIISSRLLSQNRATVTAKTFRITRQKILNSTIVTDKQTDRQIDRRTNRQTDSQTDN